MIPSILLTRDNYNFEWGTKLYRINYSGSGEIFEFCPEEPNWKLINGDLLCRLNSQYERICALQEVYCNSDNAISEFIRNMDRRISKLVELKLTLLDGYKHGRFKYTEKLGSWQST